MASCDEDRLRVKPGSPKGRNGEGHGQRSQRFVSQVLKLVSKSGARAGMNAPGARGVSPASTFGRGRVAAGKSRSNVGGDGPSRSHQVALRRDAARTVIDMAWNADRARRHQGCGGEHCGR